MIIKNGSKYNKNRDLQDGRMNGIKAKANASADGADEHR
jgi:hypothetical protein